MPVKVEITSLAYGGKGIGRIDGKVVFVPFTAPGDEVTVEVVSEKKGFSEGIRTGVIKPSPIRTEPRCPVFGVCGGCSLQHIGYAGQVEWKQRIFEETLKRIGKVSDAHFEPPIASEKEYNYRSRARFHVEGGVWGFYEGKSHRVVDIEGCPLVDPLINETFAGIKAAVKGYGKRLPLYALEIGVSGKDNRTVAVFYLAHEVSFPWETAFAGVKRLKGCGAWVSGDKQGSGRWISVEGDEKLFYSAGEMEFEAGITVFSQVNRSQNDILTGKVAEFASLTGVEKIVDLYSGIGNFTLPLARNAGKATGVESNRDAVKEAEANALKNSIKNAGFHCADSVSWLKQNMKSLEKEGIDVLVLDPPRGGEPEIAKSLSGIRPKKIIYVSCSPPTLARDVLALTGCGYRVFRAVLIDMFPQTYHIEGLLGLELV